MSVINNLLQFLNSCSGAIALVSMAVSLVVFIRQVRHEKNAELRRLKEKRDEWQTELNSISYRSSPFPLSECDLEKRERASLLKEHLNRTR